MHRLPSFCPARNLKVGEKLVCRRMESKIGGCEKCMTDNVDTEVDPK